MANPAAEILQTADSEWMMFPGGELEGKRPKALCPACRERLNRTASRAVTPAHAAPTPGGSNRPICFQCYRAELERTRKRDGALRAAGQLDTASDARFQAALPFDPVNMVRLAALKAERAAARAPLGAGAGRFADRRRQAQIAARHALQAIDTGLRAEERSAATRERAMLAAIHAAELQLPESWLPFVVCR